MYNVYKEISEDGLNRITGWIVQTPEWNKRIVEKMGGNYELQREGFDTREEAEGYAEVWFANLSIYSVYKIGCNRNAVLENGLTIMHPSKYKTFTLAEMLQHEELLNGFRTEREAQAFAIQWFKEFQEDKHFLCPKCGSAHVTRGRILHMANGTLSWSYDCKHSHGFAVPKDKVKI